MNVNEYACDKCGAIGGFFEHNWQAVADLKPKGWHVSSDVFCPEHIGCRKKLDDVLPVGETAIKPTKEQVAAWAKAADARLKEIEEQDFLD